MGIPPIWGGVPSCLLTGGCVPPFHECVNKKGVIVHGFGNCFCYPFSAITCKDDCAEPWLAHVVNRAQTRDCKLATSTTHSAPLPWTKHCRCHARPLSKRGTRTQDQRGEPAHKTIAMDEALPMSCSPSLQEGHPRTRPTKHLISYFLQKHIHTWFQV
jgi:hypothetical protein